MKLLFKRSVAAEIKDGQPAKSSLSSWYIELSQKSGLLIKHYYGLFITSLTKHVRSWENQTTLSRRRRQVILVFGLLASLLIGRLIYLWQQPVVTTLAVSKFIWSVDNIPKSPAPPQSAAPNKASLQHIP